MEGTDRVYLFLWIYAHDSDRDIVQLVTEFFRQRFHRHGQRPVVVMETDVITTRRLDDVTVTWGA